MSAKSPTNTSAKKQSSIHSSKLEAVLNTVIDGIVTINNKGVILSFNPSAERIFGYSVNEVLGKNVKILMPNPYHDEHDGYLQNYLSTGNKKVIGKGRQVEAQRKDGSIFSMELGLNEMVIDNETMFVGTIRDISDRKFAEQALKENQAKLQAIVDHTVDGLITINEKGMIETFNRACEDIFGYSASEVIDKNVKMLMPEPYHGEHDNYLNNYHKSGNKKIIGLGREVKGRRKNGSTFPLDLSVSEVNVNGLRLYSGIVRDITEQKKSEEAIRQANAELEEFSYRTSHDLRSPLVSSIKLLDMVQFAIQNDEKDQALMSIGYVQKSLYQLESLVKDILTLAQVTKEPENVELVNIETLVSQALDKLQHMDNFDRLVIERDMRFNDQFLTKKNRLVLIIENLLSNAVKYQDLKKDASFLQISSYQEDNHLVLKVSDNGLGIPENQQNQLFQMFKRFHPKIAFGSGLGLYMMKKSVDILEGKIRFENQNDGCAFIVTLPMSLSQKSL
ncbi:PAS domain-containing sensor histidine kinase [Paraglaciecola aquimarina]|uniref:histidine kinase n=1 Tax=Paraglaciecola aquimarina TaxID=1235557 RepID=A0ABU3SS45_9ALTE|nr:PAS domain-containing sensor histidine kinase [Paraglaciecola aquimarina]MDU0352810.1 PAS domain-containing sensor histidine kinase [Paraglaciecola aquimarina]